MPGLASKVHRAARWYSDSVAVVDGNRRVTFTELERRSNRLANALIGLGEDTGGHVSLLLPNSVEYVEADLALVKAGKAKVPVNVRLSADERAYVIGNCEADTLITDAAGLASVADARDDLPRLRNVLVVGGSAEGERGYEDTLARASDRAPGLAEDPEAPSVILYTSGTTGRPKGAVASFRSRWLTMVNMMMCELGAVPGDGMVHAGSMAHGSGSKTLAFFLSGARNLPMAKFDGEKFVDLVTRERATHTFLVPTMIASIIDALEAGAERPPLKTLSYGGAPIAESLLRKALDRLGPVLFQVYGSCEAPHPITVLSKADHADLRDGRAASIGREALGSEVVVGAPGEEVEEGELLVGGATAMTGYWNNPEATEAAFVDGYYRTGDVARRDADGYLYILDRRREMIISGGLNVYPAEVERVLNEHPGVGEVAVIGVPDERWGETVMAVIVPAPGSEASEEALLDHCRDRMAGYKKPKTVRFVDDLPKGSTGKILKRELREEFWAGRERMVN
jgi:acyl-CoA synthetase (AMP-forming)/AMP-acid ligase II